jgi:hypothetical protein
MIRLQASFALAVALIALGAAQASAELIHVEADNYLVGTTLTTITPPSSTLPSARVYGVTGGNPTITFPNSNITVYSVAGVGNVFGEVISQAPYYIDRWQGDYPGYDASYALKARFDGGTTPVTYVEVDFYRTNSNDWGSVRGWYDNGTSIVSVEETVELTETESSGTAALVAPAGFSFSYITMSNRDQGRNVYITGFRYGTGPEEPPAVPEPMSIVSLLLGCVGLALLRKRLA